MPKRDLQRRIDNQSPVISGEMVAVASITQVQHLTVRGPYSGDFQIVDNGRLIVGQDPDIGSRGILAAKGLFGYSAGGTNTFSVWFRTDGDHTPGDFHAGNTAANYLMYDHGEGTLGLYTPAGAGVLLDNDGSARFGQGDGANMLWDSASESLKIRSGAVVVSEIDSLGNASFTGIITATGGRIYGDMQVDARLRAGDVDGPAVYVGKLTDEEGVAYAGQIMVTDTENVPWFNVRTGSDGTGYLHIGRPGDYPNRLTLEVTEADAVLTFDGTAYIAAGEIAGWSITAAELVSPGGYVRLHGEDGVVITALDYGESAASDTGAAGTINKMVSFRDAAGYVLHRIEAWSDTTADAQPRETLSITTNPIDSGRAYLNLRAVAEGEAWARLRAIGGYGLAGQQDASVNVYAYRQEGTWNYSRIDLTANVVKIEPYTSATALSGGLVDGLLMYTDGTYDPMSFGSTALAEGLYMYTNAAWVKIAGPHNGVMRWGDATNYTQIDGDGIISFGGVGRVTPHYSSETQNASATFTVSKTYTRCNATTTGAMTATLPTASGITGRVFIVKKIDSSGNAVTLDADGSETIDGAGTYALTAQWNSVTIISNGTNWEILSTT